MAEPGRLSANISSMDVDLSRSAECNANGNRPEGSSNAVARNASSLGKRPASPFWTDNSDESRKRIKESEHSPEHDKTKHHSHDCQLAQDLIQELQCPCCSALAHRPVVVIPCQHMFCGSCCVLWIKNGGTNCPSCRGASTTAVPSRPLEIVIDTLIRTCPDHARPENELRQADQVYRQGIIRIPPPREASPEPAIGQSSEFARPCPTCSPSNPYGWVCPVPIPDASIVGAANAWSLEDNGLPPGHCHCGNCENLMAMTSPMTSRCDFCSTYYCGIGVRGRCAALDVRNQTPQDLQSIEDLLTCSEIYEQCFEQNTVEVDILIDYLNRQRIKPRTIYHQIILHILEQPTKFQPLLDEDIFPDAPSLDSNDDSDSDDDDPISDDPLTASGLPSSSFSSLPSTPSQQHRNKICRDCTRSVFLWGLRDWWVRERKKGLLDEWHMKKPDCPKGGQCADQREIGHATEYNHIIGTPIEPHSAPVGDDRFAAPASSLHTETAKLVVPVPIAGPSGAAQTYEGHQEHPSLMPEPAQASAVGASA